MNCRGLLIFTLILSFSIKYLSANTQPNPLNDLITQAAELRGATRGAFDVTRLSEQEKLAYVRSLTPDQRRALIVINMQAFFDSKETLGKKYFAPKLEYLCSSTENCGKEIKDFCQAHRPICNVLQHATNVISMRSQLISEYNKLPQETKRAVQPILDGLNRRNAIELFALISRRIKS